MKDDPTKDTGEWLLDRRRTEKERLEAMVSQLEVELNRLVDEKLPPFSFRPMIIGLAAGMAIGWILGRLLL